MEDCACIALTCFEPKDDDVAVKELKIGDEALEDPDDKTTTGTPEVETDQPHTATLSDGASKVSGSEQPRTQFAKRRRSSHSIMEGASQGAVEAAYYKLGDIIAHKRHA